MSKYLNQRPGRNYRLLAGCVLVFVVALSVVSGCGPDVELAPVTGKVLFRGEPLEFGGVMFQPEKGQPAGAVIKDDGSFELYTTEIGRGATVGENRIRVTCYEGQNPAADPNQFGESGLGTLLIPARYTQYDTSGLTVDVPSEGLDGFTIELTDQ